MRCASAHSNDQLIVRPYPINRRLIFDSVQMTKVGRITYEVQESESSALEY